MLYVNYLMSAEDFDEIKIMDQKPEKCNQRKTKIVELNFGEVILCSYCQMLSEGSFKGVEHRSLRLYLL